MDTPGFNRRTTDPHTFRDQFKEAQEKDVISFTNLGGDATLLVPTPRTEVDAYGHLAAFVRKAPPSQVDSMWKIIGATVEAAISGRPIWLSTAGGGVAWLHVRIDSSPKYYSHAAYRKLP